MTNAGYQYRERIGTVDTATTVLGYLAQRYTHSTVAVWQARIESGEVLLDGQPAGATAAIRAGQWLVWRRPPWSEPAVPLEFTTLHEDRELLVVAKPAGLPTVPGGGFLEHTLTHLVRASDPRWVPMHRLGRWTSGLVLFAGDRATRGDVARQWRDGAVYKRYRALASGDPAEDVFEIDHPIGPVPHAVLGTVHAASNSGKTARTRVRTLERRDGEFLANVEIFTGRPHQIRIHLAAAGHPLVGDPLYASGGRPLPDTRALPGDPGYLLHAAELGLRHPGTGRELCFRCDPAPRLRRRTADPLD